MADVSGFGKSKQPEAREKNSNADHANQEDDPEQCVYDEQQNA